MNFGLVADKPKTVHAKPVDASQNPGALWGCAMPSWAFAPANPGLVMTPAADGFSAVFNASGSAVAGVFTVTVSSAVLFRGKFSTMSIEMAMAGLKGVGSAAAPGFMDPEGIIVFHETAQQLFKVTLKDDEAPKGLTVRTKPVRLKQKEESDVQTTSIIDVVNASLRTDLDATFAAPIDTVSLPDATGTPE